MMEDRWIAERWMGNIESRVQNSEARLNAINGQIAEINKNIVSLKLTIARWAGAICAIVAAVNILPNYL